MVICNHDPGDSASRGSGGHVGEETMRTKNFQLNSMACVQDSDGCSFSSTAGYVACSTHFKPVLIVYGVAFALPSECCSC